MLRILHVDDEKAVFIVTRHGLISLDKELEFVWVESGEDAIELLGKESFDCIISDLQMAGMDGLEFLEKIREKEILTPFIFLTGQGNESIAAEAFRSGADDYYTKQTGFAHYERILNSIKKHIKNHQNLLRRQDAEESIKELNETLEATQSMAKVGWWSYDIKTKMPTWSKQMFSVFGVDPIKGVPHYDDHKKIWHPDDWWLFDSSVADCIKGNPYNILVRIIFPDKSIHYISTQGFPRFNVKGEICELFGTSQDVTQVRDSDEALRNEEKKFSILIQSATNVIVQLSNDNKIMEFNPEAERIFGKKREEVLGEDYLKLFLPEESWAFFDGVMKKVLAGEPARDFENSVITKEGEITLSWSVSRIINANGVPTGVFVIGQEQSVKGRKRL